jgi:hypothetical protein
MASHPFNHMPNPNLIDDRETIVLLRASMGRIERETALAPITAAFDSLAHVCYKIGNRGGMF